MNMAFKAGMAGSLDSRSRLIRTLEAGNLIEYSEDEEDKDEKVEELYGESLPSSSEPLLEVTSEAHRGKR
jgi:hypothetical protein